MTAHGWLTETAWDVNRIELDENPLKLEVGERVVIETRDGSVAIGKVCSPNVVETAAGLSFIGRRVRVRRPR